MMPTRRVGLVAWALGLLAAARLHSRSAHRVLDGIIVPREPSRGVSPPPSVAAGNKAPLPGEVTLPVQNGQVAGGGPQTGDNQVIMFFGPGFLKAPPGAQTVKCLIEPEANPPAPPSGVDIRGNVYRINCVGQPGDGPVTVAAMYHLTMRFPPGAFKEIQYNDGSGWRALPTPRSGGGGPYASVNGPGFGEYAATAPTGAPGDSIFTIPGRYVEV